MKARKRNINRRINRSSFFAPDEDSILLDSARIAASKAVRSSRALGLTIKVIRDHQIIAIHPDKSISVLRKISKPTIDLSLLRKGMILKRR